MSKKNVNISIDIDVWEKHRARGSNISDLCNTFLANYGLNANKIKEKAILKTSELVEAVEAQQKQEGRAKELKGMLVDAMKNRASNPSKSQLILRAICDKFDLHWADVVRRMERI